MDEELKKKILALSDKDLYLMIYADCLDYPKEVLAFAKDEFDNRQIDYAQLQKQLSEGDNSPKLPTSVEELIEQSDKREKLLTEIYNQPEITEVLRRYDKDQEGFRNIFWKLMACGAGAYVARSVIETPELLTKYLEMEVNRIPDLEIASKFIELLIKSE